MKVYMKSNSANVIHEILNNGKRLSIVILDPARTFYTISDELVGA